MDIIELEHFLSQIYTPLKAIESLSDTIYDKYDKEYNAKNFSDEFAEELLCLTDAIKCCTKHILCVQKRMTDVLYDKELS